MDIVTIIEKIEKTSHVDNVWCSQYMHANTWRIQSDYMEIDKYITPQTRFLDIGGIPPLLVGMIKQYSKSELVAVADPGVASYAKFLKQAKIMAYEINLLNDKEIRQIEEKFNFISLCEVIEHITGDLFSIIKNISAKLEIGGYLYVTSPNLRSISGLYSLLWRHSGLASKPGEKLQKQYMSRSLDYNYFGHVREYTYKELCDFVCSMGFDVVCTNYQSYPRKHTIDKYPLVIYYIEKFFPKRWNLFGKYLFVKINE